MKDMKDGKKCGLTGACWSHRSQLVGGFFLLVATVLTLLTLNGFGILGMFIAGALLCKRGMMCGCGCHTSCSEGSMSCGTEACDTKEGTSKPAAKRVAAKKAE